MPAAKRTTVTPEHQRAAFEAMGWADWTFEQAMADTVRSGIVMWRARQICGEQAGVMRRKTYTAPRTPQRATATVRWLQGTGPHPFTTTDLKRAAAGDRDD